MCVRHPAVDRRHDGLDLFAAKQLWIGRDGHKIGPIRQSVRIGITKAADLRLRYFVAESRHVSGPRKLNQSIEAANGNA